MLVHHRQQIDQHLLGAVVDERLGERPELIVEPVDLEHRQGAGVLDVVDVAVAVLDRIERGREERGQRAQEQRKPSPPTAITPATTPSLNVIVAAGRLRAPLAVQLVVSPRSFSQITLPLPSLA